MEVMRGDDKAAFSVLLPPPLAGLSSPLESPPLVTVGLFKVFRVAVFSFLNLSGGLVTSSNFVLTLPLLILLAMLLLLLLSETFDLESFSCLSFDLDDFFTELVDEAFDEIEAAEPGRSSLSGRLCKMRKNKQNNSINMCLFFFIKSKNWH